MTVHTGPRIPAQRVPERRPPEHRATPDMLVLVLPVVVTVAIGLTRIGQPLWLDEVASMRIITAHGVGNVLHLVRVNESTPPLWYLFAHGVDSAVGSLGSGATVITLRFISLVESAILVAVTVIWVRRFMAIPQVALVGGMLSFASILVEHRVELRAYTTLALLVVLSGMALQAASRRPTPSRLGLLALADAAGAMTHYFFVFSLAAGIIWIVVSPLKLRVKAQLLLTTCAAMLPLLAWLPSLAAQVRAHHFGFIGPFDAHQLVTVWRRLFVQHMHAGAWAADLALAFLVVVAVGIWRLLRSQHTRLAGLYALVPFAASATLWAFGQNLFDSRNLIGVVPFVAIAVAAATRLRSKAGGVIVTSVGTTALAASLLFTQLPLHRTAYDTVAMRLTTHGWHPGDPVLFFGSPFPDFNPVAWYLPGRPLMVRGRPAPHPAPACHDVFVVSETRGGREWLRDRPGLVWSAEVPFYGNRPEGGREPVPVVVAKIRTSNASLLESAGKRSASFFFEPGTGTDCLDR